MKKLFVLASLCLVFQTAFSENTIQFQFKISKPYCILNFLETANHEHNTSSALEQFIVSKTKEDKEFAQLISDFDRIKLNYSFKREEFPNSRRPSRTTYDFLAIALVNSSTILEFRNKMLGILPNSELQKLIEIMQQAEIHYDRIIWKDYEEKLNGQRIALEKYADQCSEAFTKINRFYNSFWISDIPFTVALYPIPGKSGSSTSNPYSNSLCIGVFTDEIDHIATIGVVLHEMCHVLYDEQPSDFQHKLESYFFESKSPYNQFAYNFIDEGLATALGNGWAYNFLSGKPDPADWYNNEYINGFGKALYPLVTEYISANKQIDQEFVNRAIDLFGATFPNSITDYGILLNRVSIYTDSQTDEGMGDMMNLAGSYFQLTHISVSAPILDPNAVENLKTSPQTQLVIIDQNHEVTAKSIKKIFPELSKVKMVPNKIYSFFDAQKRPIIILYAADKANLESLLKEMQTKKYFDQTKIMQN
ncbi:hypothetical protein [Fluviicola taffensis]|uniref:DUF4932 domain-containing protein n=1 Tax=Fluviicola taffensis (strain DSM 16823 / NCIMB 13979 / RW262) TaxID=755732 RepID=F2IGD8_FLUTR|nr:hypothetical protein [Fluviicola taffensis]AEA45804.1 hypothetical protein Fluta_3838 [Fluviicola taffensis DSM 16823]